MWEEHPSTLSWGRGAFRRTAKGQTMAPAFAPQCIEVRRPVVAGDHDLAVDQERRGLDAERGINDGREAVGQSWPLRVKRRTREPSRRTISR